MNPTGNSLTESIKKSKPFYRANAKFVKGAAFLKKFPPLCHNGSIFLICARIQIKVSFIYQISIKNIWQKSQNKLK